MHIARGRRRNDVSLRQAGLAPGALAGAHIAIVGGTDGLGRAIAREAVANGAKVTVVGRTLRDAPTPGISFVRADLGSMATARRVAQEISAPSLDVLIFANGIMAGSVRQATAEGIELDLAVSYLSRYVMLREMGAILGTARTAPVRKPRVFVWGFPGADEKGTVDDFNSERSYKLWPAHMNTVVGNEALVLDAAARYPGVNVYGMNPGLIKTNIRAAILGEKSLLQRMMEAIIGGLFQSPEAYATRTMPLLVSADLEKHTGVMFNSRMEPIEASRVMQDPAFVRRVMDASDALAARALHKQAAA